MSKIAGVSRIVQEADILLMLAPCYYVGVSLWIAKQRLPLSEVPAFRAIQGLALIGAGYLGLVWLLSRIRVLIFSFLPFQFLVLLLLGLVAVAYLGYQRLIGADVNSAQGPYASSQCTRRPRGSSSNRASRREPTMHEPTIDEELDALRKDIEENNS
ncbi:MAG: hypothetical protein AAFY72_01875 [Cyanobacteria bacterium J06649_4]